MAAFIAERGEDGVTSAELANVFLHPVSATPELCRRLIRKVLAGDPRVQERPDGRWAGPGSVPTQCNEGDYAAIEVAEASAPSGRYVVEWAGVRVNMQGRVGDSTGSAVRPEPWPTGVIAPSHLSGAFGAAPTASDAAAQAAAFARGATIVSMQTGSFQSAVARMLVGADSSAPLLSLLKLGRQLCGSRIRTAEALATHLDIPVREPATACDAAAFTAELLSALLARKDEFGFGEPEAWPERQHPKRMDVDLSRYEFDREFLETLPEAPGVYIMRDGNGEAVYVGKAANLRERVKSYFRARMSRDEKTETILEAVSRIDIEEKGSELEALLAEYRAIRDLQPRINVQYDVHERTIRKDTPHRRLVLVLPSVVPDAAEIFLLRGDEASAQMRTKRSDIMGLRNGLGAFFREKAVSPPEEMQIAWSWLGRNEDNVNVIDVDLAGGMEEAMRLLEKYMGENSSGGRVFHV